MLDNKVIKIWLVIYDQNPDRSYLLFSQEKVLAAVEGTILSAFEGEEKNRDEIIEQVVGIVKNKWSAPFIPLCIANTTLTIHRLELDKHSPINKTLLGAYGLLAKAEDDAAIDVAASIEGLFEDQ